MLKSHYQLHPSWFCLDLHESLFSYPFFLSPNRQPFLSLPNMPLTPLPGWSPPCEDDIVEEPVVLGLGNPVAAADSNLAAPLQDKVQVSSLTRHTTLFPFLKKTLVWPGGRKSQLIEEDISTPLPWCQAIDGLWTGPCNCSRPSLIHCREAQGQYMVCSARPGGPTTL